MKFLVSFILMLTGIVFSCSNSDKVKSIKPSQSQLITKYISKSENSNLTRAEKKKMLQKAYDVLVEIKKDSIKKLNYLDLVYAYYQISDTTQFEKLNEELIELAIKTNDTAVLAKCYWRLGNYLSDVENKNDTAYFFYDKSQKLYSKIGNDYSAARLLINMAIIQQIVKDYTGSEITTVKAIKKLKPLKKYRQLYSCYNNLGIIFNELEDYNRSLFYHEKALEYLKKANIVALTPVTLNNIGVVYENQGNHELAIINYKSALNYDNIADKDPELYAMLLDNLAYARFKRGDFAQLPELFYAALKIRETLGINAGTTVNQLHLAEYFLSQTDTAKAKEYTYKVRELSEKTNNSRDLLSSLLLLATIERDKAYTHMTNYIKLSDSLQKQQRATRNKFARIRFETDEYISETKRLNNRIISIVLIAFAILTIISLIYIIINQRSKNAKLRLTQQQQLANQEIYNLIISQQKKFEEGKENEKHRISRELHDGILGRLFGIRLSLDSLNEDDSQEIKKKRSSYVEEIKNIAEEIRLLSHKLDKRSSIEISFDEVLRDLIEQQNKGKIEFKLVMNDTILWNSVNDNTKINVYRIIQEAIQNIQKHSMATEASVRIRKIKDILVLSIEDNGKGFNARKVSSGVGLKNIKTRVKNIRGKLEITSHPTLKIGTKIRLTLRV